MKEVIFCFLEGIVSPYNRILGFHISSNPFIPFDDANFVFLLEILFQFRCKSF